MKKSTNTSDITSSSSENTENSLEDRSDRASEVNSVHTATSPRTAAQHVQAAILRTFLLRTPTSFLPPLITAKRT